MTTPESLRHALAALDEAQQQFPALAALRGPAARELGRLVTPQRFVFRWLYTGSWRIGYADDPVTINSGLSGLHALQLAVENPGERIPCLHLTSRGTVAALRCAISHARNKILEYCPPMARALSDVGVDASGHTLYVGCREIFVKQNAGSASTVE